MRVAAPPSHAPILPYQLFYYDESTIENEPGSFSPSAYTLHLTIFALIGSHFNRSINTSPHPPLTHIPKPPQKSYSVMFCGSFSHVDDDPLTPRSSSSSTSPSSSPPRKSRRKEKNPYANRGRDKFEALLADLEARREKIMAKVGEKDGFLVRFAQSDTRDWVPIVVKAKDPKQLRSNAIEGKKWAVQHKSPVGSSSAKEVDSAAAAAVSDGRMNKRFLLKEKNQGVFMNMQWPSYYWSAVLIMILLCLVMFGRSFAILCMSIWWYFVPTMKGGNVNMKRSNKKGYGRGLSRKNLGGDVRSLQSKKDQGRMIIT